MPTNLPQSFRPSGQAAFALRYLLEREQTMERAGTAIKAASASDIINAAIVRLARERHQSDHLNDQDDKPCKTCKALASDLPPVRTLTAAAPPAAPKRAKENAK